MAGTSPAVTENALVTVTAVYHFSPNGRISSSKVQALRGC